MAQNARAYIDIETTGFSPRDDELTVVGVCLEQGSHRSVIQLYEETLSRAALVDVLSPCTALYSYNGTCFDLPFIRAKLRVDLAASHAHYDLMHNCHRCGLYGGLKVVERRLRIPRKVKGVDGFMAVRLWLDYSENGNRQALRKLLRYNAEDVRNLIHLRNRLGVD